MSMKHTLAAVLILSALSAFADNVPIVQWDVETGKLVPKPYDISPRRGESVNYEPRFVSYAVPMNITGAVVDFRFWYSGQSGYYSTTGSVMAATGRVHIAWYDALCPASNALNYEVRATIGTNVLARGYGLLNILPGSTGQATNGTVYQSLNWNTLNQSGGSAVLSNQMGSGSTWSGTQWTFGAGISATECTNIAQAVVGGATQGMATVTMLGAYLPTSTVVGVSAATATGISESVTASMMLTGNVATATSAGTVTGAQSNTIATAVQPAALVGLLTESTSLGVTNVTGGILTLANRMVGLTASAISNAMAGVYQLAGNYWTSSHIVATSATTNSLTSPAQAGVGGIYWILTNSASWYNGTGTLSITTTDGSYLADISYDSYKASSTDPMIPGYPTISWQERTSSTQITISAYCYSGGMGSYYMYVSNLVAYTYDIPGMTPNTRTNDAAAVVARVDDPAAGDARGVVNARAMAAYVAAQAPSISRAAWDYTPSGATRPDKAICVIDQPMVQQGNISYMQAGDYYCQSAVGDQVYSISTGSVWRIGPAGRIMFELASTNKLLGVTAFTVINDVATLTIPTNDCYSVPSVEATLSLVSPQWLTPPDLSVVLSGSNYVATAATTNAIRFFRAVCIGGEHHITSYARHDFAAGMTGDASGLTNITPAQVVAAGGLTNVTPAAVVAAGGVLLSPVVSSNLLALVANGTCSVPYRADAPATDQQVHMAQTQAVTLAMGAFSTNSAWSVPLSWHTMGYQLTYCPCTFRTNLGTMRTNSWNLIIASRPAFETNWTATVIP